MLTVPQFIYSQLFVRLPYPTASFVGKTVIVTGSNVGLGKEAARHIVRLGASAVILAVRSVSKGEAAKQDIQATTKCNKDTIKVWQLDMSSYQSVQDFAAKVEKECSRVDAAVLNAGIAPAEFETVEDCESTIVVNDISTFLLAMLLLPKLRETARKYNTRSNLTIVASEVHFWAKFEEGLAAKDGKIFERLAEKRFAGAGGMSERYQVSKLLNVYGVRAMAEKKGVEEIPVTINCVNPGLCHSELARDSGWGLWFMKLLLARSTEYGSRTLVTAAIAGSEAHGAYMSDCGIHDPAELVTSQEGHILQQKVWNELGEKFENISPGIMKNL